MKKTWGKLHDWKWYKMHLSVAEDGLCSRQQDGTRVDQENGHTKILPQLLENLGEGNR
jgi:hypothetical protein